MVQGPRERGRKEQHQRAEAGVAHPMGHPRA